MRIRLACAAGLLLSAPTSVLALGLGPMQTNSSLNEPFEGKIALVDANAEELDTLKVGLADRAQFTRAGLDYLLTLSDLRFELVQPRTGSDYVRVWSKEPVREPVLDFLLEANWSSGRLIREFTVLLDPPRYEAAFTPAARLAATVDLRPRLSRSSSDSSANTKPGSTAHQHGSTDPYGPTQAGDTLWEIAQGARSNEVSVQQMMLALLQVNPSAFINGNVNHLKRGVILRIPEASELTARAQVEALAEVRRHNALWEEYRQRLASSVPERSTGAQTSQGSTLATPAEAEETRLEVLRGAANEAEKPQHGAAGTDEPGQGAGAEAAQWVAEESQAATQDENSHLRQRLKESEALVELLRRQVQLRDDELAALQAKLAQAGTATPEVLPESSPETIAEQPEGGFGTEAGEPAAAAVSPKAIEASPRPAAAEPGAEAGAAAAASGAATETAGLSPADETAVSPGTQAEPLAPEAGREAQLTTDPSAISSAVDSQDPPGSPTSVAQAPATGAPLGGGVAPSASETLPEGTAVASPAPVDEAPLIPGGIYSAVGLVALTGMVIFWVFWRSRAKSQGAKYEDELTVPPQPEGISASEFSGTRPSEDKEVPLVERTADDRERHVHDVEEEMEEERERTHELAAEKDPLEEVNLCVAYERFDEAELLVQKAIAAHPGRHDYKLRLLDVYYAAGNKRAYERAAQALNVAVGGQGPLWDDAMAMWYEISPERPLFAERSGEGDRPHEKAEPQREVLDITMVSGGEPRKLENSLEMLSDLDFDLGTTQDRPISGRGEAEEEAGEYTDVFDLSSPEDAAAEGIVDVTVVGEDKGDKGQVFDLSMAEPTSGAGDMLDLTTVDAPTGGDQEMLDLSVADNAADGDGMLDLTSAGSDRENDGLDFDITGGHELPETTGEPDDALHLTVPKASFPSAKSPEPQEQLFEITHPTEHSGSGAEDPSVEIVQETVELPREKTMAAAGEGEEGIQTIDLFGYFQKGGAPDIHARQADGRRSLVEDPVPEAGEPDFFVVSVDDEDTEVVDVEMGLDQSDPGLQTLREADEGSRDVAMREHNRRSATGAENRWGDPNEVTSLNERRSQKASSQGHVPGVLVEGEAGGEEAWARAHRDSDTAEADVQQGQGLPFSEQGGPSPVEEEAEVGNVARMSNTVEFPGDSFGTESDGDPEAQENEFVVIEDLTAPEEVVVIDLNDSENTQEIDTAQETERFAHTVKLPHAFSAAAAEAGDVDLKLNLAKEYIELGNPKGAREILDEVAHSGSAVQKRDAEALRRQLG